MAGPKSRLAKYLYHGTTVDPDKGFVERVDDPLFVAHEPMDAEEYALYHPETGIFKDADWADYTRQDVYDFVNGDMSIEEMPPAMREIWENAPNRPVVMRINERKAGRRLATEKQAYKSAFDLGMFEDKNFGDADALYAYIDPQMSEGAGALIDDLKSKGYSGVRRFTDQDASGGEIEASVLFGGIGPRVVGGVAAGAVGLGALSVPEEAQAGPKSRLAKYLIDDFNRIGDKPSGTFDGGLYTDPQGVEWFVKEAPSDDHAKNEVLASKLYAEAGVKVPEVDLIEMPGGKLGIASRKEPINRLDPDNPPPGTNEGYAADAWLANWDTAGLTFDNMYESGGEALRLDAGGALRYRAQGAPKGRFFGDTPGELDTLRDEGMNPQSSRLFRGVTDEHIKAKANQIREIPEERIRELVNQYGPDDDKEGLVKTLLARRSNLPAIAATLGVGGAAMGASEESEAGVGSGIGKYARDQYRDLDLYHGTPNWEEGEIDLSHAQRGASGDGFYTTTNPDEASKYAGGGPVWSVKDQAPLEANAGAQVLPLLMRKDALVFDYHGNPDQVVPEDIANDVVLNLGEYGLESDFRFDGDTTVAKLADYLNESGADDRVIGEVLGQSGFDATRNGDHFVFRNPNVLKSRFAKFEGPGLMGGVAAGAVGAGALAAPDRAIAQEGRWGRENRLAEQRRKQEDSEFVGRLSRDRGDLYAPEREWAVAGAEAVQNLPGGEFVPFMDQIRKWGWGDKMQPLDYAMMALDATDFIPGAAAIGLPAKKMAKQAAEEAIQSRLMAGEAVEKIDDSDYGVPPYQEGEVGFDLQGLIDDILYSTYDEHDPNDVAPNSLNAMFASASKQLGKDPSTLAQAAIDQSVPVGALDFSDEFYKKLNDKHGIDDSPMNLPTKKAEDMMIDMYKWYKQQTGKSVPHPYDLADEWGPGIFHMSPAYMFDFFEDLGKGKGYKMASAQDTEFWRGYVDEFWTAATDAGVAKSTGFSMPKWYSFPEGNKADVLVNGARPEIFEPFKQEAAAKGLPLDPPSRLQRAVENDFRFEFDTPTPVVHVTGGKFKRKNPDTGEMEDVSDITEFESSRGPLASFFSGAPYSLIKQAVQAEDKFRRSYPVGIQGRMFAYDPPEDWFLPKELDMADMDRSSTWISSEDEAVHAFRNRIWPNAPQDLQDWVKTNDFDGHMENLWKETAWNRYAPTDDTKAKFQYIGPLQKSMYYRENMDDLSKDAEQFTFTAPIKPPHFLSYEDYTFDPNTGGKRYPYQEIIQQMGYNASKVDDEAGYSIAADPEAVRSWFANFDPDRMKTGSNPSKNIMAGLGLSAVSLPAIMASLTGDDEDGYWAGLLQDRMAGNGYN